MIRMFVCGCFAYVFWLYGFAVVRFFLLKSFGVLRVWGGKRFPSDVNLMLSCLFCWLLLTCLNFLALLFP